jgi:glycosyltransferase involved in cell wall biosynthesis
MRTPQLRPADLPASPVAAYVGTLHDDRIDVDLVDRLARELPAVQLVFVGPNALTPASTDRLAAHRNVHLLGIRPYADVPAYLQHADVIIVPHAVNAFTDSLDPIKAYECLAVGRPTLATPVSGFVGLGLPVRIAGRADFPGALNELLAGSHDTVDIAVPSWADRAARFLDVLTARTQ